MKETMAARVAALREMTVDQLRAKHVEVFGEANRSRNKDFLWKRIAWRIQALEEGDLSERVRRRAAEIANDADVRVRAPQGAFGRHDAPAAERTRVHAVGRHAMGRVHDPRLPMPGTVLTRAYKEKILHVTVMDEGFLYEGRTYGSLSAIATEATGSRWNGFLFFGLTPPRAAASGGGR